jgi:hypothetical protein
MVNEFLIRIGSFFIWIGVGLVILFVASLWNNAPDFKFFFLGVVSIFLGARLFRRKAPPPPSGRFALYRKLREGSRKEPGGEGKEGHE